MVEILYYWKERIGTCRRQVLDNASQIPFQLLGGVPHDAYGMTSISIRQYVLGIYKHLGLREKDVTKVQTGGPGTWFCLFLKYGIFPNCVLFACEQMETLVPVRVISLVMMTKL